MSQQGEDRHGHEDDWWRELYEADQGDTGPAGAPDSLDDRYDSAARTLGAAPSGSPPDVVPPDALPSDALAMDAVPTGAVPTDVASPQVSPPPAAPPDPHPPVPHGPATGAVEPPAPAGRPSAPPPDLPPPHQPPAATEPPAATKPPAPTQPPTPAEPPASPGSAPQATAPPEPPAPSQPTAPPASTPPAPWGEAAPAASGSGRSDASDQTAAPEEREWWEQPAVAETLAWWGPPAAPEDPAPTDSAQPRPPVAPPTPTAPLEPPSEPGLPAGPDLPAEPAAPPVPLSPPAEPPASGAPTNSAAPAAPPAPPPPAAASGPRAGGEEPAYGAGGAAEDGSAYGPAVGAVPGTGSAAGSGTDSALAPGTDSPTGPAPGLDTAPGVGPTPGPAAGARPAPGADAGAPGPAEAAADGSAPGPDAVGGGRAPGGPVGVAEGGGAAGPSGTGGPPRRTPGPPRPTTGPSGAGGGPGAVRPAAGWPWDVSFGRSPAAAAGTEPAADRSLPARAPWEPPPHPGTGGGAPGLPGYGTPAGFAMPSPVTPPNALGSGPDVPTALGGPGGPTAPGGAQPAAAAVPLDARPGSSDSGAGGDPSAGGGPAARAYGTPAGGPGGSLPGASLAAPGPAAPWTTPTAQPVPPAPGTTLPSGLAGPAPGTTLPPGSAAPGADPAGPGGGASRTPAARAGPGGAVDDAAPPRPADRSGARPFLPGQPRSEGEFIGARPPTYAAEPTALPLADPADLDALVPDTALDGARYGPITLRAVSSRGDSARYRGEPRRDALLTARFGTGDDALLLVAVASGVRAAPAAHRAAGELCASIAGAIGRSAARLADDVRGGRRAALKSGLHRLTDRAYGRLRAHAGELGLDPAQYTASLRCLLLPVAPGCRTRVFFGVGDGGLFRLRGGAWTDLEPVVVAADAADGRVGEADDEPTTVLRRRPAAAVPGGDPSARAPLGSAHNPSGAAAGAAVGPTEPDSDAAGGHADTGAPGADRGPLVDPRVAVGLPADVPRGDRGAPDQPRAASATGRGTADAAVEPFRFQDSIARPGDTLLLCSPGLAEPFTGQPALAEALRQRWSEGEPPGLAAFLADVRLRVKGYADDRTAVAVWEA